MMDVEGKVAFITGGSSGIGLGIARAFAEQGMKVAIGYKTPQHLEEALRSLEIAATRVHAIQVDVTDRAGMQNAARETLEVFGKIHVLVNNAGVLVPAPLSQTTFEDWDWTMSVNLNGVFNGIQAFLPLIQAQGEGGQIITVSSIAGLLAESQIAAYSVSKFAVVGMMEALREELVSTNIGVSVCCPGGVYTDLGNSGRNRPHPQNQARADGISAEKERRKEMPGESEIMLDPLEVGRLVLRGMRDNDLYILTHPEYEQILQDRNDALLASIPRDLHPTPARVSAIREVRNRYVYTGESARRLCSRASKA